MGKCVYSREWPKQYPWVKDTNSKHKTHYWPVIRTSIQMGESALQTQVQGAGHKKQEKAMLRTFVNFSQVKTETATTPQLNTFGFNRIVTLLAESISFLTQNFSLDLEPMDDSAEFTYLCKYHSP